MKRKLIFITKIYTQDSYFYAEDKNFNLKLRKMLYYNILRCLFVDVQTQTSLKQKDTLLGYPHVEFVPPPPPKRNRF